MLEIVVGEQRNKKDGVTCSAKALAKTLLNPPSKSRLDRP